MCTCVHFPPDSDSEAHALISKQDLARVDPMGNLSSRVTATALYMCCTCAVAAFAFIIIIFICHFSFFFHSCPHTLDCCARGARMRLIFFSFHFIFLSQLVESGADRLYETVGKRESGVGGEKDEEEF